MKKLVGAISLFLLATVLHFIANATGLYDMQIEADLVWFDNVLHFFIGGAAGLFCVWLIERYKPNISRLVTALVILTFVISAAVIWELMEFALLKFFTSYAKNLQIYSPSLTEAAYDVLSNAVGALALITWLWLKNGLNIVQDL